MITLRSDAVFSPPNLQELVLAHGGYDRIPAEAWAKFHQETVRWQAYVGNGGLHPCGKVVP